MTNYVKTLLEETKIKFALREIEYKLSCIKADINNTYDTISRVRRDYRIVLTEEEIENVFVAKNKEYILELQLKEKTLLKEKEKKEIELQGIRLALETMDAERSLVS